MRYFRPRLKVSRLPSDLDVGESNGLDTIQAVATGTEHKHLTNVTVEVSGLYEKWSSRDIWTEVRKMFERAL